MERELVQTAAEQLAGLLSAAGHACGTLCARADQLDFFAIEHKLMWARNVPLARLHSRELQPS